MLLVRRDADHRGIARLVAQQQKTLMDEIQHRPERFREIVDCKNQSVCIVCKNFLLDFGERVHHAQNMHLPPRRGKDFLAETDYLVNRRMRHRPDGQIDNTPSRTVTARNRPDECALAAHGRHESILFQSLENPCHGHITCPEFP